jgi:hypothetical protein
MLFRVTLRESHFDGNDLGKLETEALPTTEEVSIFVKQNFSVKGVLSLMIRISCT